MNIFNRIVMLLLGLVALAFGTTIFLLLTGIVIPQNEALRNILGVYAALQAVARLRGTSTNIAALIAIIVAIVGLVVVVLELLPIGRLFRPRESKQYVIRHDELGQVTVGRTMVHDFVQHEAEATPGVTHAEASVKDGSQGLIVSVKPVIAWDANAPAVGQQLQERLKDAVQTRLGLTVAEVKVSAQAASPSASAEPRRRALA